MISTCPIWQKVLKRFDGDVTKTVVWFDTVNPMLGGLSPLEMMKFGRTKKLEKFVDEQIALNEKTQAEERHE